MLEDHGSTYEEYDLSRDAECFPELRMRLWRSGADPVPLTVPQIFRGAAYIGGSDRLEAHLRSRSAGR